MIVENPPESRDTCFLVTRIPLTENKTLRWTIMLQGVSSSDNIVNRKAIMLALSLVLLSTCTTLETGENLDVKVQSVPIRSVRLSFPDVLPSQCTC
jgi:hypothetical protein